MSSEEATRLQQLREQAAATQQERHNVVREAWVKAMEARLVREELERCQKGEGIHHYENCRWLAEKYLKYMDGAQVKGWKTVDV